LVFRSHVSFVLVVVDGIAISEVAEERPRPGSDGVGVRNQRTHSESCGADGSTHRSLRFCRGRPTYRKPLPMHVGLLGLTKVVSDISKQKLRHYISHNFHDFIAIVENVSLSHSKLYILYAKMGMLRPYCNVKSARVQSSQHCSAAHLRWSGC
jgi:hypothetical protein